MLMLPLLLYTLHTRCTQAHAGAYFTTRLLDAMSGKTGVKECTFVQSDLTAAPFFASPCTLGPAGVEKVSTIVYTVYHI
jgi:malate/lactate dehydrogenase